MTVLQTLGQSLNHWQAIYIVSICTAVLSTFAIVVFAFHIREHRVGLKVSNYVYVMASLLAVIATIVIVNKTHSLDAEKDRLVKVETAANELKVAQAREEAETAKATAAIANQKAEEAEKENIQLRGVVVSNAGIARTAEAALDAKNRETSDFAQLLAVQQQKMAGEAKLSPVLDEVQIRQLAAILAPYAGQRVDVHLTSDTTVGRLARGIEVAFNLAHVTTTSSIDMGQLYQGVSVAVHSPQDVPPIANALVKGLRKAGIEVHPVALANVPPGQAAIYLGPN